MKNRINEILNKLNNNIQLVAVSKYNPIESIDEAYSYGLDTFGENHVQELVDKYNPKYKWHFIGHLQTNKVKYIIDKVTMIQSLDSIKLAKEINKQALKHNLIIDCLIQVNISNEQQKYGISINDIYSFTEDIINNYPNINIKGLMCIAENANNNIVKKQFETMSNLYKDLQSKYPDNFKYLSMGMSNDYELAIKYNANIVRIGSSIFGKRVYNK